MSSYRKKEKAAPAAVRIEKNRNDMVGRHLQALRRRDGLTVTEFRRFRRNRGFIGQPLGYMEAVRILGQR